ncbi:hypothetical protein D3C80_1696230 [compost metagenome]
MDLTGQSHLSQLDRARQRHAVRHEPTAHGVVARPGQALLVVELAPHPLHRPHGHASAAKDGFTPWRVGRDGPAVVDGELHQLFDGGEGVRVGQTGPGVNDERHLPYSTTTMEAC